MKSLTITSPNVLNKHDFSFQDIEKLIFNNENPEQVVKPFPQKYLKNTSITFGTPFIYDEEMSLTLLMSCIKKINNKIPETCERNQIPLTIVPFLISSFRECTKGLQEYVLENIKEFCESEISIINWKTLQVCGVESVFGKRPTFLQKLWISINTQTDRDFWLKTATDIRESLLPWLNNELWTNLEKNKENKRTNVAYEEQRRAMVEGTLTELDKKQHIEDEDLDIIT